MRRVDVKALILLLILGAVLLPGCYDTLDIERRMIVSPIGIDSAPGKRLRVTLRMPLIRAMPAEQTSETNQTSIYRSEVAYDFSQAVTFAQEQEEHALFFGQCRAVIIGQAMARRGVRPIIDALYRHKMLPPSSYVVVAKPTAEQVLKIKWPEVEIHDQNIRLYFEDPNLPSAPLKLWYFIQNVLDDLEDPVVPLVEPSVGGTTMRAVGAVVFRGDRAVGELNRAEAILYQILHNSPKRFVFTTGTDGTTPSSFAQVRGRTKIEADWRKGKPVFTIRVKLSGNLAEYNIRGSFTPGIIKRLEKRVAGELATDCENLLHKLQSLGSDPLELGNRLRIKEPQHFSLEKWPAIYRQADFTVAVSFSIQDFGKLK